MGIAGPAATVYVDVEGDLSKFKQDLRKAGDDVKQQTGAWQRNTRRAGAAMTGVAVGAGIASAKTAIDFDKNIREVYTLLPDASGALRDKLVDDAKVISTEYGQKLGDVTTAMYDSISAGVDPEAVQPFLAQAGKLAIAGATDIGTAVDGLTGVINAYGAENITAAEASDIMFATVKAGKTTIEELGSKVSNITPIASDLGISFEQVGASVAAVTAVTGNTAEASTQLKAAFVELGKKGTKSFKAFEAANGQTFREFVAGGGIVSDGLVQMGKYADETGVEFADMFGSVEAGGAALIIAADGGAKFNESLQLSQEVAGETDTAFAEMEESVSFQMDQLKASLSVAALNIGNVMLPALAGLAGGAAEVATFLSELPGPIGAITIGLVGFGGALLFLAGPIMRAIQLVRMMNLAILANPYVLAAAALIAFAVVVYKNWDTISRAIYVAGQAIFGFLDRFISQPMAGLRLLFEQLPATISAAWEGIKTGTADAVTFLVAKLGELLAAADSALGPLDEIAGVFLNPVGAAKSIISGDGIPGFDTGGIVPGATGSPQLILAHGGETVPPTHKDPNAGAGGNISISVTMNGTGSAERDGTELARILARELDAAKRGAGRSNTGRFGK